MSQVKIIIDGTMPRGIILSTHTLRNTPVSSAYDDAAGPPPHTEHSHSALTLRPGLNTVDLEELEKHLASRSEYLILTKCSDTYLLTRGSDERSWHRPDPAVGVLRAGAPAATDKAPSASKTPTLDDIFHK